MNRDRDRRERSELDPGVGRLAAGFCLSLSMSAAIAAATVIAEKSVSPDELDRGALVNPWMVRGVLTIGGFVFFGLVFSAVDLAGGLRLDGRRLSRILLFTTLSAVAVIAAVRVL